MVSAYHCPASETQEMTTTYLAVVGEHECFREREPRRLEEITDGHNSTMMVIEAGDETAVPWMRLWMRARMRCW